MALYEYQCQQCGEIFELIQKFSDEPLTVHEKCGGKVERLVSAPALQFKGSGWYVNDYAKGSGTAKPAPNGGESKSSDSSKSSGSSTDSGRSSTPSSSESKSENKSEKKSTPSSEKT